MNNILITRHIKGDDDIVFYLENKGFKVVAEPLFTVEKIAVKPLLKEPNFLIITSANASEALLDLDLKSDIKIYAVGQKTAQSIAALGFSNISWPKQHSAAALKELILCSEYRLCPEWIPAQAGIHSEERGFIICGLYLCGPNLTLDFSQELPNITKLLTYKIHHHSNFSTEFLNFSKNNSLNAILIFSKNSAKIFSDLAKKHNLLEYFNQSQILCFSEKIQNELRNSGFKNVQTFANSEIISKFYG